MSTLRVRLVPAVVLALALVTGCVGPGGDPVDPTGSATTTGSTAATGTTATSTSSTSSGSTSTNGSPSTETATTPATETSGSTSAQSQTNKPVATVPQLPIGGGADDPGDVEQCVNVSFLGDEIPPDIAIVPEAVSFSEPLFVLGGSECAGDDTPCLSGGFTFTAQNDDTQEGVCFVGVRAIGERAADDFRDVDLVMTGRLVCPPGREVACEVFAQRLDADDQSIQLTPPTAQPTTSETTTSEATTSATTTTSETATSSGEAGTPTD